MHVCFKVCGQPLLFFFSLFCFARMDKWTRSPPVTCGMGGRLILPLLWGLLTRQRAPLQDASTPLHRAAAGGHTGAIRMLLMTFVKEQKNEYGRVMPQLSDRANAMRVEDKVGGEREREGGGLEGWVWCWRLICRQTGGS
jgi:hypothetical protein